jgi:hypothetical protein
VHEATTGWSLEDAARSGRDVYLEMAEPFAVHDVAITATVQPVYRFPVLLHWSFTSTGRTTFASLMQDLDSGLLGTVADDAPVTSDGRQPRLEVVETGHVGLPARTRTGDAVRVWYRGPLVPHPTADPPSGRLPLAHVSDQLRVVIPDGREDVSLAAAFEIGRLLALSHPSSMSALLRWRQRHYQTARRGVVLGTQHGHLEELLSSGVLEGLLHSQVDLGTALGRHLAGLVVEHPGEVLGPPRLPFDPGRPLDLDSSPVELVASGFRLDAEMLSHGGIAVLPELAAVEVPVVPVHEVLTGVQDLRGPLQVDLAGGLLDLVSGALVPQLVDVPVAGPTIPRTRLRGDRVPDRLDAMLVEVDDEDGLDDGADDERPGEGGGTR